MWSAHLSTHQTPQFFKTNWWPWNKDSVIAVFSQLTKIPHTLPLFFSVGCMKQVRHEPHLDCMEATSLCYLATWQKSLSHCLSLQYNLADQSKVRSKVGPAFLKTQWNKITKMTKNMFALTHLDIQIGWNQLTALNSS